MSNQAKIARCREKNRALSESPTLHGLATTFEAICKGTFEATSIEGISVSLITSIFSSYPLGEGSLTRLTCTFSSFFSRFCLSFISSMTSDKLSPISELILLVKTTTSSSSITRTSLGSMTVSVIFKGDWLGSVGERSGEFGVPLLYLE